MCICRWHAGRDTISHIALFRSASHRPETQEQTLGWGRAIISRHRRCHLLRRVLAYIAPHIRIRVVRCPYDTCTEGHVHLAVLPSFRRHRVPIAIPTADPWRSRKQSFDGLPGLGPRQSPSSTTLSLSQSHRPARRYPAVETAGPTHTRRHLRSSGHQACQTGLPTSQAHYHLIVKLILETSDRIDQFRFERTLYGVSPNPKVSPISARMVSSSQN